MPTFVIPPPLLLLLASIGPIVVSSSPSKIVMAMPDEATTYTGHPILVDVLSNDRYANDDDGGTSSSSSSSSLVLSDISVNGAHGKCAIVGDIVTATFDSILYEPDGGYSGSDECVYEVCSSMDESACDYATLAIVIAKQMDANFDFVSDNVPPIMTTTNDDAIIGGIMTDEGGGEEESPLEFDLDYCPSKGDDGDVLLTLELQTDAHGEDVSWEIREVISSTTLKRIRKGGGYARYSYDRIDICVDTSSTYAFVIYDEFGDGLCNHMAGACGYYKLYLDGREIIHVSYYGARNNHRINVGYDPTSSMSDREFEYLIAHNDRRKVWHETYNASYVPLLWSPMLAEEAATWAKELLSECDSDDIEHETGVLVGENLAKNKGYEVEDGVPSWGQLYPPESAFFVVPFFFLLEYILM
jgi:hypothetical protein